MSKKTRYVARLPDVKGYIYYSQTEHDIWQDLYLRPLGNLSEYACFAYQKGLNELGLSESYPHSLSICMILVGIKRGLAHRFIVPG